jgi:hypothetical protein
MAEYANAKDVAVAAVPSQRVPDGYRQGLITAITVLLVFSLAFLRFWGSKRPALVGLPQFLLAPVSMLLRRM